jgi:hypothetical protein
VLFYLRDFWRFYPRWNLTKVAAECQHFRMMIRRCVSIQKRLTIWRPLSIQKHLATLKNHSVQIELRNFETSKQKLTLRKTSYFLKSCHCKINAVFNFHSTKCLKMSSTLCVVCLPICFSMLMQCNEGKKSFRAPVCTAKYP